MEKEFIGEAKSWKEIEKKAKELFEEGKIDGIDYLTKEYWEKHQDIHPIIFGGKAVDLKTIEYFKETEFCLVDDAVIKIFKLFLITKSYKHDDDTEDSFTVLAVICP